MKRYMVTYVFDYEAGSFHVYADNETEAAKEAETQIVTRSLGTVRNLSITSVEEVKHSVGQSDVIPER